MSSKTFIQLIKSDIEKFNPYHDRLGRFTTGGGFGMSSSVYTGDPSRQAVTFSANPKTKAGAMAIDRHGGVVPTAYGMQGGKPSETPKETEKPKENKKQKTIEEATEYAKNQLGMKNVDFSGMDAETANHVNETIAKIQSQYPELKGTVSTIEQYYKSNVNAAMRSYPSSVTSGGDVRQDLLLGDKYRHGMKHLAEQERQGQESGWNPPNCDISRTIWHEYGHAWINVQKAITAANKEPDNNYWRAVEFDGMSRKKTVEKGYIRTAAKELKTTQKALVESISRYGQTNAAETFAEAFAEYHTSSSPRAECVALMRAAGIAN
jgi:hypothetical protein